MSESYDYCRDAMHALSVLVPAGPEDEATIAAIREYVQAQTGPVEVRAVRRPEGRRGADRREEGPRWA